MAMINSNVQVRLATFQDIPAIRSIYAPYVENTAISFEFEVPSTDEFMRRMEQTLKRYPYLVAVNDVGDVLGYAYASTLVDRRAYDHVAEVTIYLREDARGQGIGPMLYSVLEGLLVRQGIVSLYACIGHTDRAEEPHMRNSKGFHAHVGYRVVGKFVCCGYKFGRWYDVIWMEKLIAPLHETPDPFVPFAELSSESLGDCDSRTIRL